MYKIDDAAHRHALEDHGYKLAHAGQRLHIYEKGRGRGVHVVSVDTHNGSWAHSHDLNSNGGEGPKSLAEHLDKTHGTSQHSETDLRLPAMTSEQANEIANATTKGFR